MRDQEDLRQRVAGARDKVFLRSKFEDTRQKAVKFGANGATVKAYKPGI